MIICDQGHFERTFPLENTLNTCVVLHPPRACVPLILLISKLKSEKNKNYPSLMVCALTARRSSWYTHLHVASEQDAVVRPRSRMNQECWLWLEATIVRPTPGHGLSLIPAKVLPITMSRKVFDQVRALIHI